MFIQELPFEHGVQDGYILQLVLLSIFLAVTLVLLSVLLIACRRCCEGDQSYAWWDKSLSYLQIQTCYWQVNIKIIHLFIIKSETSQPIMNFCFSLNYLQMIPMTYFLKKRLPQALTNSVIHWLTDWLTEWMKSLINEWVTNSLVHLRNDRITHWSCYRLTD